MEVRAVPGVLLRAESREVAQRRASVSKEKSHETIVHLQGMSSTTRACLRRAPRMPQAKVKHLCWPSALAPACLQRRL